MTLVVTIVVYMLTVLILVLLQNHLCNAMLLDVMSG